METVGYEAGAVSLVLTAAEAKRIALHAVRVCVYFIFYTCFSFKMKRQFIYLLLVLGK